MSTLEVSDVFDVARAVSDKPPQFASGTALLLHRVLVELANEAREARGYAEGVAAVVLHCPVDIVATALRRHRVSVWRAARQLKAAGVLDWRAQKTTVNGRTVNDGTLWAVALRHVEGGVRLSYDDMKHQGWRDLENDIRRGRTAHAAMQQSRDSLKTEMDFSLLQEWTLPPVEASKLSISMTVASSRRDLESVLDVQFASRAERPAMVETAADSLAAALRDTGGRRYYMLLMWALLRLQDATGAAPWYAVYEQARRAQADAREGFARKPGALFASRLKVAPWYSEAMNGPPLRVASA